MKRKTILTIVLAMIVFWAAVLLNCSKTGSGGDNVDDGTAPALVTDLSVESFTDSSVTLTWTASGDDGNTGTATRYEIRTSTAAIHWLNYDSAEVLSNVPVPQIAGSVEHYTARNLESDSTYYFALKVFDENDNCNGISNIVNATCINDYVVNFADAGLLAAVRTCINKPSGSIYKSDLLFITDLNATDYSISDLSGIRNFPKLAILTLSNNAISDLSPLSTMVQLEQLYAGQNNIEDLTALEDLTGLSQLNLNTNQIADIEPLANLVNLTELDLRENLLVDISVLADLTELSGLHLTSNAIRDIGPLVDNAGIGSGDDVVLSLNPLSHESITSHIPTLLDRGVNVGWIVNTTPPFPISDLDVDTVMESSVKLSWTAPGEDYLIGTAYKYTLMYSTDQADLSAWSGGTLLEDLPDPDTAGTAQTYTVTGLEAGTTYYFAIKTEDNSENWSEVSNIVNARPFIDIVVTFPDGALEAAIRDGLNKPSGDIYKSELVLMDSLIAESKGIEDLTGLENCSNLLLLHLGLNEISNINALSEMLILRDLDLRDNSIADISPLSSLTSLIFLQLSRNPISNLEDLENLTGLILLNINSVATTDIQPLSSLTNLQYLYIFGNSIDDISMLSSCPHIIYFYADYNLIDDISVLSGMTGLNNVYLRHNQVQDISPLVNNTGIAGGDQVALESNPLSLQSIDTYIPALQARGVTVTY